MNFKWTFPTSQVYKESKSSEKVQGKVQENNTVCKSEIKWYPLVSSNEILVSREMLSKFVQVAW